MLKDRSPQEFSETLQRLRRATEGWIARERTRVRCPSGMAPLDALLGGGWPAGKVAELVGPRSSGRTGVAMSTVAAATARGEVVAWIDLPDAFDPSSAVAAGVDLERVLWARPQRPEEAVRAAELVLEACGFTVAVLDVGAWGQADLARARSAHALASPARGRAGRRFDQESRSTLRLRLARAVERAGATVLVLAERVWVGTCAGVRLGFGPGEARWEGEAEGPRWLAGIALDARAERGGAGPLRRLSDGEAVGQGWGERAAGG